MLSVVYRLVGFDRETFSGLVYYKLPATLCLALSCAVFYLFLRRRFSRCISGCLALLLALSPLVLEIADELFPDLPFLLFSLLAYWLTEVYLSQAKRSFRRQALLGVLLGLVLWYAYLLRLNGVTIVAVTALAFVLHAVRRRKELPADRRAWCMLVLPFLVFCGAVGLTALLLPSATSNLSDVGAVSLDTVKTNTSFYLKLLTDWLSAPFAFMGDGVSTAAAWVLFALMILGMVFDGFRKDTHLALLLLGTLALLILLPYTQGLRYMFNVLPIMLLFIAYGAQRLYAIVTRFIRSGAERWMPWLAKALCIGAACVLVVQTVQLDMYRFPRRGHAAPPGSFLSIEAEDMYRYIRENTSPDSVIMFFKPRALHLATDRLCVKPQVEERFMYDGNLLLSIQNAGLLPTDADYYLTFADIDQKQYTNLCNALALSPEASLSIVYQNATFTLYRLPWYRDL